MGSNSQFGCLLRDVAQKGDVILTAEFSRLGRSALQVMLVLEEAAKRGVTIHIVKNGLVMDGSLNARMMALAFGMAAEIEREFISRRTTEALAKRKAEGKRLGRPPGAVSAEKKLDKRKDEILDLLKTRECRAVDSETCSNRFQLPPRHRYALRAACAVLRPPRHRDSAALRLSPWLPQ
jgi:DNA invertase Pin-like site-specific DNA recombinase